MDDEQQGWDVRVEAAWTAYEGGLADRIARMRDDETFRLDVVTGVDADGLAGAAPYLQLLATGDDCMRAEVVSNVYLDERYRLSAHDLSRLTDVGWREPGESEPNFSFDGRTRDADRIAMMAVTALREVFGCPHPSFISFVSGADDDAGRNTAYDGEAAVDDTDPTPEPLVVRPRSEEHLRQLIDSALKPMLGEHLHHDEDGDVPVVMGKSVMFVGVVGGEPTVDIFAQLVMDVSDLDRVPQELMLLNDSTIGATFYAVDDTIHLRQRVPADPFAPAHLRAAVARMCVVVDELARRVAVRVGGRRFLEPAAEERAATDEPQAPGEPRQVMDVSRAPVIGLLELLHDGPVPAPTVAALFDHARLAIIDEIVRIRTGRQPTDGHDEEVVLSHLRSTLRFVSDAEASAHRQHHRPPPARSRQLALLPEPGHDQPTLDSGRWDREIS